MKLNHPALTAARRWLAALRAWWFTPRLVRALGESPPDWAAAMTALARGASADAWVANPKDVIPRGEPVLVFAARAGRCDLLSGLLSRGATLEARSPFPFDYTALATAVLAQQWEAAELLSRSGARWDTPVEVISLHAMAQAMTLDGLDPARAPTTKATLEQLVRGTAEDTSDYVRFCLVPEPQARALCEQSQARRRAAALESALPGPGASPATSTRL